MMRKRTRSLQKDQHQMGHLAISDANSENYFHSHALGCNIKSNSIFSVPRLFVGLSSKGLDSDSVRSPTSPLEFRVLSNLGGNLAKASKPSLLEGNQRSWDCSKVGLSIIDTLEDCPKFSGKILQSSESKNISVSPRMRIKTPNCQTYSDSFEASKSLPKNFGDVAYTQKSISRKGESKVIFEIGDTHELFGENRSSSSDSCSPFKTLSSLSLCTNDLESGKFAFKDLNTKVSSPPHFIGGSQNSNILQPSELNTNHVSLSLPNSLVGPLSASEIELSEDYTCVISHGPNPKTTHFFGDCVLDGHFDDLSKHGEIKEKETEVSFLVKKLQAPNRYPSSDFLSFCYHCNKKLEDGKDIFMYRGEKAFCSLSCRAMEIMIDEELDPSSEISPKQENVDKLVETGTDI